MPGFFVADLPRVPRAEPHAAVCPFGRGLPAADAGVRDVAAGHLALVADDVLAGLGHARTSVGSDAYVHLNSRLTSLSPRPTGILVPHRADEVHLRTRVEALEYTFTARVATAAADTT